MKVYIITTKHIGDNCLFNAINEHKILDEQRPDNNLFGDLRYDNVKERPYCHSLYYKIGNDNDTCNVIGLPFLPGRNNARRLDSWKGWLRNLCPGNNGDENEYIYILHDKDCTNNDTPFSRYGADDTYVFMHDRCDCFYRFLQDIDMDVDANTFEGRFENLVRLNDMYNEIDVFLREERTPQRNVFEEVDVLLGNNQGYANQFDTNTDIKQLLSDIRDKIEDAI